MTELTITPDYGKKRLKFAGTVAAGEHVAVTVAGAGDWASAEGAVLRLRVMFGNALVGIAGGDAETENPWQTHSDDPTIAEGAARCELNLNTIPAEKMLKCGGNCFWILDDATNHTFYGAGEWDVRAWPKHRGVDEPIDLDGYPQLVEDMEDLKEAWEAYKTTVNAALEGKADASDLTAHTGNTDIHVTAAKKTEWDAKYEKPETGIPKSDLASAVQTSLGKADTALQSHQDISGKADLVDGKVPSSQLPSYVDDVIEVADYDALPDEGEQGKIYVTTDDNMTYRWSGTQYVEIASPVSIIDPASATAIGSAADALAVKTALALKANDAEVLKNSGNQTLDGTLASTGQTVSIPSDSNREANIRKIGLVPAGTLRKGQGKLGYGLGLKDGTGRECSLYIDDDGKVYINTPSGYVEVPNATAGGTLALVSQIYAAVRQIAPAWVSGTTYTATAKVSYNGVVYARKTSGSITSSTDPATDTVNWEAKKVSELFLPLTGGTITGGLTVSSDGIAIQSRLPFGNPLIIGPNSISTSGSTGRIGIISFPTMNGGGGTFALLQNIAADYSTSATYALNALCVNSGTLYRCTTAITTAEAWTAAHWTEATVQDVLAAIWTALDLKAPLASPAFTGTPTAPTAAAGTNTTQVATTAFVQGALPYAIATKSISNDAVIADDRTVNFVDATSQTGTLSLLMPLVQTSGKSRDFYFAIKCGATPPTVTAPYSPINTKGETPDLTLTANATTVLRFTEVANGTTSPAANPVFVVTGGANGGGSIDPATLNTKANSTALAPDWRAGNVDTAYAVNDYITYNGNAYVCMVAYTATSSSPTPNNDIYNDTVTPATGHWKLTDMTTPDATLDVTSQGSLRVVSAGGQTLWQQGYKLASASSATLSNEGVNIFTFAAVAAFDDTASYAIGDTVAYDGKAYTFTSAHSGAWTGSDVELAAQSFSLPAAPTGKVGDFILEIDNTANASVAVAIDIAEYTNTTISLVIPDGAAIDDMTAIGGGVRCEFYFTQTAFNVNSKPTWKVVRQDVEVVAS